MDSYRGRTITGANVIAVLVQCPTCNKEMTAEPIKRWKYGHTDVMHFVCSECRKAFNLYRTRDGGEYTIPKQKPTQAKGTRA